MNHAAPEDWQAELRAAEAKGYARGQEDFRDRSRADIDALDSPFTRTAVLLAVAELEILPIPAERQ